MDHPATEPVGSDDRASLRVYVVWHEDCADGVPLAKAVFGWLRGDPSDLARCGSGIPVDYHVARAPTDRFAGPELDAAARTLHVVVALIDAHFVLDRRLREWCATIAEKRRALLLPVALHGAAYRLPGPTHDLNFLRVDGRDDDPLRRTELRTRRLLRLLTQVLARRIHPGTGAGPRSADAGIGFTRVSDRESERAPPKIRVFVSHAKMDGRDQAASIRRAVLDHGQLEAFFDESDLAVGYRWESELEAAASDRMGGMLVVLTDAYASRPWCVREVRLARTPRSVEGLGVATVVPVRVLAALDGAPTFLLPELGSVSVQLYDPERIDVALDELVRDIVLQAFDLERGLRLREAGGCDFAIGVRPDPLLLGDVFRDRPEGGRLGFPGASVPSDPAREWLRHAPGLHLVRVEDGGPLASESGEPPPASGGRGWVGLSVGEPARAAAPGVGLEHVQEASVQITRTLLRGGLNVAYGGDLRVHGFTRVLFDVAREADRDSAEPGAWTRRFANFLSWDRSGQLTADEHATLAALSRFVIAHVDGDPAGPLWPDEDRRRWLGRCLTTMRVGMQRGGLPDDDGDMMDSLRARVVLGGKVTGYSGFLPGIVEEVVIAVAAGSPVVVLGGFGGAAGMVAALALGDIDARRELERLHAELPNVEIPGIDQDFLPSRTLGGFLAGAAKAGVDRARWRALLKFPLDDDAAFVELLETRDLGAIRGILQRVAAKL